MHPNGNQRRKKKSKIWRYAAQGQHPSRLGWKKNENYFRILFQPIFFLNSKSTWNWEERKNAFFVSSAEKEKRKSEWFHVWMKRIKWNAKIGIFETEVSENGEFDLCKKVMDRNRKIAIERNEKKKRSRKEKQNQFTWKVAHIVL